MTDIAELERPEDLTPAQWSGRLAALKSRQVPDTDPRVRQARWALSFWRCQRALDAEAAGGYVDPATVQRALAELREVSA